MAVVIAIVVVSLIGLICSVILSAASKVLAVPVDERFPKVRECLPGANCGACGYAGCDGYTQALLDDETLPCNKCVPGAQAAANAIAAVLGREAGESVPMVAHVRCNGTCENTQDKYEFGNTLTCRSAKLFYGNKGTCPYGCLGCGDCASVCPEKAICIENGIAHIDIRRCIGCGKCANQCPQKVIEIIPKDAYVTVNCNNKDKAPVAMKVCKASCIGCGLCAKNCPADAITITDNLASIDFKKCVGCVVCSEKCPKKAIVRR